MFLGGIQIHLIVHADAAAVPAAGQYIGHTGHLQSPALEEPADGTGAAAAPHRGAHDHQLVVLNIALRGKRLQGSSAAAHGVLASPQAAAPAIAVSAVVNGHDLRAHGVGDLFHGPAGIAAE